MKFRTLACACSLASTLTVGCQSSNTTGISPEDTAQIANRYIQLLTTERDQEAAVAMMSEDVTFIDPTAEVWGGTLGKGISGRPAVDAVQKSWRVEEMSYDVSTRMVSGSHALFSGKLSWTIPGAPIVNDVPFITMLTVRDGLITAREDFGDYDEVVILGQVDNSAIQATAAEYIEAYTSHDTATMERLLAPDVILVRAHEDDHGAGQETRGAAAVLRASRAVALGYPGSDFNLERVISSYRHVIYVGDCQVQRNTKDGGTVQATMPLWICLKMVDGKIVEQLEYSGLDDLLAGSSGTAAH